MTTVGIGCLWLFDWLPGVVGMAGLLVAAAVAEVVGVLIHDLEVGGMRHTQGVLDG